MASIHRSNAPGLPVTDGSTSSAASGTGPRLIVQGVSKKFGGNFALRDVSFRIDPGEIHALVGENGAGKSTVINAIGGVIALDAGSLVFNGSRIEAPYSERDAIAAGIGIVHQERSLVGSLSVAENIFGASPPVGRGRFINSREMVRRSAVLLAKLELDLDPTLLVRQVSPAHQQMVEIAKALAQDLSLLVLDEPTAALTRSDTDRLFRVVRALSAQGVSVLFVSHRLEDIFVIAENVTVFRDGQVTSQHRVSETNPAQIIRDMVGRDVAVGRNARTATKDLSEESVLLSATDVAVPGHVIDASISVRSHEIVCIAGLIGSGRSELCEAIVGARRRSAGEVQFEGRPAHIHHPADARDLGIGLIPEDRRDGGIFSQMSVQDNVSSASLSSLSRRGVMSPTLVASLANEFVQRLQVVPRDIHRKASLLSGGNQQKLLIARWLARKPRVLIVDEPTRGVDVGAREEIYNVLRQLSDQGAGIVVVSSDLQEVLGLADRIVVMAEGRTVGELQGDVATEEAVLNMMSMTGSPQTNESKR